PHPPGGRAGDRARPRLRCDRQSLEGRRRPGRAGPEPDAGAARDRRARGRRRLAGARSAVSNGSFFRSRWVDKPANVTELEPTALPDGFLAAGAEAGLKPQGLDVGVLFCAAEDVVSAARFTTNARVGAPVSVSRESA